MKNSIVKIALSSVLTTTLFTGCVQTSTQYVGGSNEIKAPITAGLSNRDLRNIAEKFVSSLIKSGRLDTKGEKKYSIMISSVINDTSEKFNTEDITRPITQELENSGLVYVTTAMGSDRDNMTIEANRSARDNEEFNQEKVADKGGLVAGELGLSGRITQKVSRTDDGNKYIEYTFSFRIVQAETGLSFWSNTQYIEKITSGDSVTW